MDDDRDGDGRTDAMEAGSNLNPRSYDVRTPLNRAVPGPARPSSPPYDDGRNHAHGPSDDERYNGPVTFDDDDFAPSADGSADSSVDGFADGWRTTRRSSGATIRPTTSTTFLPER